MPDSKQRSTWPVDDEVRELEREEVTSEDGRKLQDAEYVGATAPDADADAADEPPPRPAKPAKPVPR